MSGRRRIEIHVSAPVSGAADAPRPLRWRPTWRAIGWIVALAFSAAAYTAFFFAMLGWPR